MENKKIKITQAKLDELNKEYKHLIEVDKPRNQEALKDARAQGDLSENADYDAARNEQARIEGRLKEIQYILDNHIIIVGRVVTLYFMDKDITQTYTIVGSQESNPREGKISDESPVGKAIEGANIGDRVTVHANGKDFDIIVKDLD